MKYQVKFTVWMTIAAVVPLAVAGTYLLYRVGNEVRELERIRFKLSGRELVRAMEVKAYSLKDSTADTFPEIVEALKNAAANLGLEAMLVTDKGEIKARTKGAVEKGPHDVLASTAKGGIEGRTRMVVETCGFLCEDKSAVSPLANTPYMVAFWLAGDTVRELRGVGLELLLLLLVSLFTAVAVGLHVTGPLKETLSELRQAASQLRQGGIGQATSVKTSDEFGSVLSEFNAVAEELHSLSASVSLRDKEAWARFESETQRVERLKLRLLAVEALAGVSKDPEGRTPQDLISAWFDQEGQAAGNSMEMQGKGTAWPEGSGWMCTALLATVDVVMSQGKGPYRLALLPHGFEVEFKPDDRNALPPILEPISGVVRSNGGQYGLKGRYDRIIIKAIFPDPGAVERDG